MFLQRIARIKGSFYLEPHIARAISSVSLTPSTLRNGNSGPNKQIGDLCLPA